MSDRTSIDYVVRSLERNRRLSLGLPVNSIRAEIPAGYKASATDPKSLVVDLPKYELLKEARKHLRESPYKEVAAWLTAQGLTLSHNGLHKLMNNRPPYTDDERKLHDITA